MRRKRVWMEEGEGDVEEIHDPDQRIRVQLLSEALEGFSVLM